MQSQDIGSVVDNWTTSKQKKKDCTCMVFTVNLCQTFLGILVSTHHWTLFCVGGSGRGWKSLLSLFYCFLLKDSTQTQRWDIAFIMCSIWQIWRQKIIFQTKLLKEMKQKPHIFVWKAKEMTLESVENTEKKPGWVLNKKIIYSWFRIILVCNVWLICCNKEFFLIKCCGMFYFETKHLCVHQNKMVSG